MIEKCGNGLSPKKDLVKTLKIPLKNNLTFFKILTKTYKHYFLTQLQN